MLLPAVFQSDAATLLPAALLTDASRKDCCLIYLGKKAGKGMFLNVQLFL